MALRLLAGTGPGADGVSAKGGCLEGMAGEGFSGVAPDLLPLLPK